VVNTTPRPFYPWEGDTVHIVQEAGWTTRPVWKGTENFAPTGIRPSDLPARSEWMYRLSYAGSLAAASNQRNLTLRVTQSAVDIPGRRNFHERRV